MLDLDFALGVGRQNRIDERGRSGAMRQFRNRQNIFAGRFDGGPHLNLSSPQTVVVIPEIRRATIREIGANPKRFALQVIDRGPTQVVEIVRQDFGRESDRDAFRALEQDQRKFGRQRDRFLRPTVIALLPRGRLRIEQHIPRKGRQTRLDVTRGRRAVAGQSVTKITLRLD